MPRCRSDYIGKTELILFYRIQEHKGESSNKTDSAFNEHQLAILHKIYFDNVKTIDRAYSEFKLHFKDILQIDKRKPLLNKQLNSSDSYRIKTYIIGSRNKI